MIDNKSSQINLVFATQNIHKFNEIQTLLANYPIQVEQQASKTLEIQSDNLIEIAQSSVIEAVRTSKVPTFIEDTGLYIDTLKGFPGSYASYVQRTIGNEGILKLMTDETHRNAHFKSVIAYCTPISTPEYFVGSIHGTLSLKEKGTKGFGFDSIFIPETYNKTFGEMELLEKNSISHRGRAVTKFINWLLS